MDASKLALGSTHITGRKVAATFGFFSHLGRGEGLALHHVTYEIQRRKMEPPSH